MYKLIVLCCLLGLAMASQPKKVNPVKLASDTKAPIFSYCPEYNITYPVKIEDYPNHFLRFLTSEKEYQ